jgi:hypothetical protein
MLQGIVATIIEHGPQVIGWAVLKAVSLGRYRGFRPEDMLFEGAVGFLTLVVFAYGAYRWFT